MHALVLEHYCMLEWYPKHSGSIISSDESCNSVSNSDEGSKCSRILSRSIMSSIHMYTTCNSSRFPVSYSNIGSISWFCSNPSSSTHGAVFYCCVSFGSC